MSGVLHPKLAPIHPGTRAAGGRALELDDEPTHTAIRPARAYANDGPESSGLGVEPDDDDGDDKPEPITWVRSRHPRVQH